MKKKKVMACLCEVGSECGWLKDHIADTEIVNTETGERMAVDVGPVLSGIEQGLSLAVGLLDDDSVLAQAAREDPVRLVKSMLKISCIETFVPEFTQAERGGE